MNQMYCQFPNTAIAVKHYTFILILGIFLSCNNKESKKGIEQPIKQPDSSIRVEGLSYEIKDTPPVEITEIRMVGNARSVSLRYKNVSDKTIQAIRFKWYGENVFGEPVNLGSVVAGYGGGYDDQRLAPGKTKKGTWPGNRDLHKITKARVTEVIYTDGTRWKEARF